MKEPALDNVEKSKLDEILDLCAEYERQIEAEQREIVRQKEVKGGHQVQSATMVLSNKPMVVESVESQPISPGYPLTPNRWEYIYG